MISFPIKYGEYEYKPNINKNEHMELDLIYHNVYKNGVFVFAIPYDSYKFISVHEFVEYINKLENIDE